MTDSAHTSEPKLNKPQVSARIGAQDKPQVDPNLAPFLRAENEDDDGYDPYSDRPPTREPLFEADPWA